MTTYRCPECGDGIVEKTLRQNFHTKIRGVPFVVPDAIIGVCNNCGREFFGAKEVKRWGRMFDKLDEAQCRSLGPAEVDEIRRGLRLTIGGFALFMGCTRQTVHNWLRRDRKAPQLRMADLLLRLVDESRKQGAIDVVLWLEERARELGAEVDPVAYTRNGLVNRPSEGVEFRPLEDYEKLFAARGQIIDVPTLTA